MRLRSVVVVPLVLVLACASSALAQRAPLVWVPTSDGERPMYCDDPRAVAAGRTCEAFFASLRDGDPVLGEGGFVWRQVAGVWTPVGAHPGQPGCIETYPGFCVAPPGGPVPPPTPPVRFELGRYYQTPYNTIVFIAGSVVRRDGAAVWVGECLWGADCSSPERLMFWPLDYDAQFMAALTREQAEAFIASKQQP